MLGFMFGALVSMLMLTADGFGEAGLEKPLNSPLPELLPLGLDFDQVLNQTANEPEEIILDDGGIIVAPEQPDEPSEPSIEQPANSSIVYVPMPMPDHPREISLYVQTVAPGLLKTAKNVGNKMKSFYGKQSRHKINITPSFGLKDLRQPGPNKLKLIFRPGAHSHVPIIGNAIGAAHEFGHELGFGHANTRIWGTQTTIKQARGSHDPFDCMVTAGGSASLNAAHLHYAGWFNPTEEAYAQDGGEYVLSIINAGGNDYSSLKALYYEVPGSSRKVWLSYARVKSKGWHAPARMPGTAVAIHSNGGSSTFFEGLIGLEPELLIRYGLIVELSEVTARTVKVKITKDPTWVLQD